MYIFDIIMHIIVKGDILMKKNIKYFLLIFVVSLLTGCLGNMGPSEKVEEFLNMYIKQDTSIINELEDYLNKQDLTQMQKARYRDIIKDEYSKIEYEIINEKVKDEKATVDVNIIVKDLYGASQQAENDLLDNPLDFYTEGVYDSSKFIDHKLDIMENYKVKKNYIINLNLTKYDNKWVMDNLDESTLEKLHGIFKYET